MGSIPERSTEPLYENRTSFISVSVIGAGGISAWEGPGQCHQSRPIDTGVFADVSQEFRNKFVSKIPMGRFGRQEEVATAALFLASDGAFIYF
jgi:NAD(P)-dependent dehydrogenase (short-subunit alcohol dehydrogenase family)